MLPGEEGYVYSYTQLTAYATCHYSYFLKYMDEGRFIHEAENAFAQYGSLIHQLIDEWAKHEITKDEMADAYITRYPDTVTASFPRYMKGIAEKMYDAGLNYCENFDEFAGYEVLETEKLYFTDIGGHQFKGIVDMVLFDHANGDLIILDHKSKSLATFKKEQKTIWKQQILYSKFIAESIGEFPTKLAFNLFREGGMMIKQAFDIDEYNRVLEWAANIMDKIEENDLLDLIQTKEKTDTFCKEICGMRTLCPMGQEGRK